MTSKVKNPRQHAELIKQWADDDSLIIETQMPSGIWKVTSDPMWRPNADYRIQRRKVIKWQWVFKNRHGDPEVSFDWYCDEGVKKFKDLENFTKLEWTAKEFEVY